jgi:hypothetical protein
LLNSHIARSCVPVVLAHLSEFQLVLTSHVESYPTSCLLSRPGDYASHESISFTTGKYNQVKYICFPISDCHHCDILRHALLGAFQTCQPALALLLGCRPLPTLVDSPERLRRAPTSDGLYNLANNRSRSSLR